MRQKKDWRNPVPEYISPDENLWNLLLPFHSVTLPQAVSNGLFLPFFFQPTKENERLSSCQWLRFLFSTLRIFGRNLELRSTWLLQQKCKKITSSSVFSGPELRIFGTKDKREPAHCKSTQNKRTVCLLLTKPWLVKPIYRHLHMYIAISTTPLTLIWGGGGSSLNRLMWTLPDLQGILEV